MLPHTADTTGYNYCMHSETKGKYFVGERRLLAFWTPQKRKSSLQSQNNGHLLQTTLKWLHCNQCIIVQGSWQYAAPQVFQLTDHMDEHSSIGQPKITYFHFASEIIGIHCHKEQIKQELECLYLHFNSVHHQNKISSKQNSTVAIGNRERANSH